MKGSAGRESEAKSTVRRISPPPRDQGHTLQRSTDRYAVRWLEGGYWHARFFALEPEAAEMLTYVQQYDPNGYVVAVR